MINPHNPEFITKRPWYLGESGPSLVHHSKQKVDAVLTMKKADELVQQRWASKKKAASGFRKVRRNNGTNGTILYCKISRYGNYSTVELCQALADNSGAQYRYIKSVMSLVGGILCW